MLWIIMSGTGLKNNIALIYDSPVTKTVKRYTYGELRDLVAWVISYFKKRSARGTMYFRF
jgi:acyl-coenzyme A synthetase/AMP-(fatty) acid ligase